MLLDTYRKRAVDDLLEDIETNQFYTIIASVNDSTVVNSDRSATILLEQIIFGKKLERENVFYLVKHARWIAGKIFAQYDDLADLSDKDYYAVVYESDGESVDYNIYKCLFNNYGTPSINAPIYDEDVEDQIYRTLDGYVWKYMYTIPTADFAKYSTTDYIPVIESTANTVIENSAIDTILVENTTNRGYTEVSGEIDQVFASEIIISGNLNIYSNFYNGQSFYVTDINNISRLYQIETYEFDTDTNTATVVLLDKDGFITSSCSFKIFPRIRIMGDGTGASAIPILEDGTVKSILVLNAGSGYTSASATLIDPLFAFDPSVLPGTYETALLRPILSPVGGHGYDIQTELKSKAILIYTGFTSVDNLTIPTTNDFCKVAIGKNLEFSSNVDAQVFDNRLRLTLTSNPLAVGDTVKQFVDDIETFSGYVHEVDGNDIYLVNYVGAYPTNPSYGDMSLDESLPIKTPQNQLISINNVDTSSYVQKTGELYYMSGFDPITRTNASEEEFKIIIEF